MKNYFVYLPDNLRDSPWGCTVTSVGYSRVAPRSVYPPQRHPDGHHFTWSRGRILQAHQILLISEGRGNFESTSPQRKERVSAGDVMVVFPGVWHRYAPDRSTGWVEHWIELRGPALDRAARQGVIDPKEPVICSNVGPDMLSAFERAHGWAMRDALQNQSLLSTLGLHMLAMLGRARARRQANGGSVEDAVQRAQMLILQRCDQPLNVEHLADELHAGYSHFRKAFRSQTGVSPKQFHLHVRLQKAQDFLTNTDKSVKEISEILGFNSQFHLSSQFKASTGVSPRQWRARLSMKGISANA